MVLCTQIGPTSSIEAPAQRYSVMAAARRQRPDSKIITCEHIRARCAERSPESLGFSPEETKSLISSDDRFHLKFLQTPFPFFDELLFGPGRRNTKTRLKMMVSRKVCMASARL